MRDRRRDNRKVRGFTLVEMLTAAAVIGVLTVIVLPTLSKARKFGRGAVNKNNLRQIAASVNLFEMDNGRYPHSVATLTSGNGWNWHDPRTITSRYIRFHGENRAEGEHLSNIVEKVDTIYCPNAPKEPDFLQEMWDAGDDWDCPYTRFPQDPFIGTYSLYWNYVGKLRQEGRYFVGPKKSSGGIGEATVLVSDSFFYHHYRARKAFGSCEKFRGVTATEFCYEEADYWYGGSWWERPEVKLNAAYVDGHVETYCSEDTTPMEVIIDVETGATYQGFMGMGVFYVPLNGIGR